MDKGMIIGSRVWAILATTAIAVAAICHLSILPAAAEHCAACADSICSSQGFRINFKGNRSGDNGRVTYTYEICNEKGQAGSDCQPPHDLSHIDVELPNLDCISEATEISIQQVGCVTCDPTLKCGVDVKDPSCDLAGNIKVLKCDVESGDLEGKCVTVELTIAGEVPTGPSVVNVITKAGPACGSNQICGPVCNCSHEDEDECLTRSAGFWGTHPEIAAGFLPATICSNIVLDNTDAGSCTSTTEAMCVSPGLEGNKRLDRKPAREQLARQLTAYALNLKATAQNGGSCGSSTGAADALLVAYATTLSECNSLCGATETRIKKSGCLEALDAFNNSQDTMLPAPAPFDAPGPADPGSCQDARGNGVLVLKCP